MARFRPGFLSRRQDSNGRKPFACRGNHSNCCCKKRRIRPLAEAHLVLNHPLAPPFVNVWRGMRKVGVDECLGFKADVLESETTGYRYWVIDHPDFGAFSARWNAPGDRPRTNEVLRVQVGAP
jgi:hypothetical protein